MAAVEWDAPGHHVVLSVSDNQWNAVLLSV
jgi:hypothetical protein